MQQLSLFSNRYKPKKKVPDDFKAYLVEGAQFTQTEGYPILEEWMIPKEIEDCPFIIPMNQISRFDEHTIRNAYISFYCRDRDFKKIMNSPSRYLRLFRKAKAIIGFDFSIYEDMPLIKQKSQINDNLSLSFYYGIRNIKIIPNIRYGSRQTRDGFLEAIPKNSIISIGSYGCVRSKNEKQAFREFLKEMLPAIQPSRIIVYGAAPNDVFKEYQHCYKFCICPAMTGLK